MQPTSIKRFDAVYLAALAVYIAGFFLGFEDTVAQARAQTAAAGSNMDPSGLITGFFIAWLVLGALLWWLISSRASNGAKWTLVVLYVLLELLTTAYSLATGKIGSMSLATGLSLASILLKGGAIVLLFQPDAVAWLERERPAR